MEKSKKPVLTKQYDDFAIGLAVTEDFYQSLSPDGFIDGRQRQLAANSYLTSLKQGLGTQKACQVAEISGSVVETWCQVSLDFAQACRQLTETS